LKKPQSLGSVLNTLIDRGAFQRQHQLLRALDHWQNIVGADVATHAQPLELRDKTLFVAVSSPTWAQQLAFQRRTLLNRLKALLGDNVLNDIRFQTTGWAERNLKRTANPEKKTKKISRKTSTRQPPALPEARTLDERLERVKKLAHWSMNQWPCCPRCGLAAPASELERHGYCIHCFLKSKL
jgi:hypothetical protein